MEMKSLPIAVRAYAVLAKRKRRRRWTGLRNRPPQQRTLVFDTETTIDPSQRLLFGSWRYFVDKKGSLPGTRCMEEGIFYADDLEEFAPEVLALLRAYVGGHPAEVFPGRPRKLKLLPRSAFAERVLFKRGVMGKATVVCFNSPFDLARIATDAVPGRDREDGVQNYGGNSLTIFEEGTLRPRVTTRALDSKRSLLGLTKFKGSDGFRGDFVDCRTLCFALTGEATTLEGACKKFDVDYKKREVTYGDVTEGFVTYCREDVWATAELFKTLVAELRCHPVELEPSKAFSPASIGKAYLRALGIIPALRRQPRFKKRFLAMAMEAFYGGRAECRIRRTPVPVVHTDFVSMYPSCNALMRTWELTIAERIDVVEVTDEVRSLVEDPEVAERMFEPTEWQRLACLVELESDGSILPVRARYDEASDDFGIGVNPLHRTGKAYYALGDVLASVVPGGPAPNVLRAWRLVPVGRQDGLEPVSIRKGTPVDPDRDFFAEVVERRQVVARSRDLPEMERQREESVLKVIANSASYGILAEFVRRLSADPVEVRVFRPDGSSFTNALTTPEEPGEFSFPPVAACITAAARLMLALLEREITVRGGTYAFCDTDSMAIVAKANGGRVRCSTANGASVKALSWSDVDDIVAKFARLNPYDVALVPGSILKVEKVNFDETGAQREVWCLSIAAKRYCFFVRHRRSFQIVGEPSEHGLGQYLSPLDDDDSARWIRQFWELILARELGSEMQEPEWLEEMVVSRVTASGPHVLQWFKGFNEGKVFAEQIKPANFVLLTHQVGLAVEERSPIAPYERDASKRLTLSWVDRLSGEPVTVTTAPDDGTYRPGVVHVRTFRDVATEFVAHPEAKSLSPDGSPCDGRTRGLLQRRTVVAEPLPHRVGKEGNEIDDRVSGLALGPEDYRNEYEDPDAVRELLRALKARLGVSETSRRLDVDRRTLQRILNGSNPHKELRERIVALAIEFDVRRDESCRSV